MRTVRLAFGIQPLPSGYHVEWWEQDEHYHWVNGDRDSVIFATRWQAWRDAWQDYRMRAARSASGGDSASNRPDGAAVS